jgi:hypothetical protein
MGCLPLERATNIMDFHGCVEGYNNLALEFNGKLEGMVAKLNKELPGLNKEFEDVYNIFLQIIRRPSAYGKFGWTFLSLILPFSHMRDTFKL